MRRGVSGHFYPSRTGHANFTLGSARILPAVDATAVDVVALIARLALAGTFAVSGVAKLRDRAGAHQAVRDFGVPGPLVGLTASLLAPVELASAALLLTAGWGVLLGALVAAVMLVAFTVGIVANLTRGKRVDCHCFGQLTSKPLSWRSVARNVLLLAVAVVVLAGGSAQGWPWQVVSDAFAGLTPTEAWLWAAVAALAIAVGVIAALFFVLLRSYGHVLLRLEALERAEHVQHAHGHAHEFAPWPAPPVTVTDAAGNDVELPALLPDQGAALFVFVAPHCEACGDLVGELTDWQAAAAAAGGPLVVVLSPGERVAIADKFGEVEVHAHDGRLTDDWRVEYTPGAVVVNADGLIVSPPAYGADDVRRLHRVVSGHADPADVVIGPPPVREGDPVPQASVEVDGVLMPLSAALAAGQGPGEDTGDTVLLFWDTACGFCQQLVPDVVRRQDTVPLLMLLRNDDVAGLRAAGITAPVALDRVFAVGNALRAPGTPCAVRVRDGAIASTVAVGGPEVLDLLAQVRISG